MDRSLWLLLRLRCVAWCRVWVRNLKTLKGALLALVGGFVFVPLLGLALVAPRVQTVALLDAVRRYGPLGLLVFCVLNVLLSSGDRTVRYSPAEVHFLFCGPYRPRQMLLYKVAAGVGAGLVTAVFLACQLTALSGRFLPTVVALFLTLQLIYLFSMTLGLLASTFGALAFSRGRRVVVAGVGLAVVASLAPLGRGLAALSPVESLERALRSPAVAALTLPFTPFVNAFASERLWPDLAAWSALALLVDLLLLSAVLSLNAGFLEASAAAGARVYDRLRRDRPDGAGGDPARMRIALPMPPWWGGVGPNVWRQLTTLARAPWRLALIGWVYLLPAGAVLLVGGPALGEPIALTVFVVLFGGMTLPATAWVGCDFRPDLARMEDLKTLPIRPSRLALGQLLTPVVVLSASQWATIGVMAAVARACPTWLVAAGVLVPPVNLILVAVENLYFLWFPYRPGLVNSLDFQYMGRQVLLGVAKLATTGVAAAASAAAGALVYSLTGPAVAPAVAAAGGVALACGLALVPLVGVAFAQFDVAADRVE